MLLEMQNLAVILSLWFAVCAEETVSEPSISMVTPAPDPELVKRQTYDYYGQSDFIGYYAHGSIYCGSTYETFYRAPFTSLPNIGPTSYPRPPPQPTSPTTPSRSSVSITPLPAGPSPSAKVQIGPIVGGVIGGIAVLLSVIVGIWLCLKKKRQSNVSAHEQSLPVMIPQQPQQAHPAYALPEKVPVTAQTSPYTPQQQWASSPTSMSPPGSPPPPTYFPQPTHQPPNPQQQQGPFP
ncbi:hypothetical protein B0O99DRAFT_719193 [Bisporella sp. PMI_857]|nr:hypothetical protein B0O99DRAFT_719193 [Bisporella sp. PMI_857]